MTDSPFVVLCREDAQFFDTYQEASDFATYVDEENAPGCGSHKIFYLTPVPNLNSIEDRGSPHGSAD